MTHLRAVDPLPEPIVDVDELRARLHSAETGCLEFADKIIESELAEPDNLLGRFVLIAQYRELRRTAKRLRAWLSEVGG